MIMAETPGMEEIAVRAVTLKEDLAVVALNGVPNTRGIAARVFAEVSRHHILVDDIVQNLYDGGKFANLGFSTNGDSAAEALGVCENLVASFGQGSVEIDEGVSKVSAVGIGMRTHTGVAATMFDALARAEINIENISTSEIVVSCIVCSEDGPRALRCLHEAFGLDKDDEERN